MSARGFFGTLSAARKMFAEDNRKYIQRQRAASGMSAGTAETTKIGSGPQDRQPDGEAGTPKGQPEQPR